MAFLTATTVQYHRGTDATPLLDAQHSPYRRSPFCRPGRRRAFLTVATAAPVDEERTDSAEPGTKPSTVAAKAPSVVVGKEVDYDTPKWAGETPLSKFVNVLIGTPPLFALMKAGARRVLINTAETAGVLWRMRAKELGDMLTTDIRTAALADVTDKDVDLPDYYKSQFHAYKHGNLEWLAAFEAESATLAMGLRNFPNSGLEAQEAFWVQRGAHLNAVFLHAPPAWFERKDFVVMDAGCGVGLSTYSLVTRLTERQVDIKSVIGLDASPYFLAVAKNVPPPSYVSSSATKTTNAYDKIDFKHGLAEETGFDDESVDWHSLQLVAHELPTKAMLSVVREAFRVLKPGGMFSMFDNDPKSEVLINLPPVLFTLMKSTEPWTDEYYRLDIQAALRDAGFINVTGGLTDPRHRTVVAMKPLDGDDANVVSNGEAF